MRFARLLAATILAATTLAGPVAAAPVSFRGFSCDALGSATALVWSPRSNVALYRVGNIGASGQDGITVTLPLDADGWRCDFGARPDGTGPCDQLALRLYASASPGTPAFATLTQWPAAAADACTFECAGAAGYAVCVYDGATLVHSARMASPPVIELPAGVTLTDPGVSLGAATVIHNLRSRLDALEPPAAARRAAARPGAVVLNTRQRVNELEARLQALGLLGVDGVAVTGDRFVISAFTGSDDRLRRLELTGAGGAGGGAGGFSVADHALHARKGINAVNVKLGLAAADGTELGSPQPGVVHVVPGAGASDARVGINETLPYAVLHVSSVDLAPLDGPALAAGGSLECGVASLWSGVPDTLRLILADDGSGAGLALALVEADATRPVSVAAYSGAACVTLSPAATAVALDHAPTGFHARVQGGDLVVRCPLPAGATVTLGGVTQPCDSLELRVHDAGGAALAGLRPGWLLGHALAFDLAQAAGVRADQFAAAGGFALVAEGEARLQPLGGDIRLHGISAAGGDGLSVLCGSTGVRVPIKGTFADGDIPDQQDFTARAVGADGGLEDVAALDWLEGAGSDGLPHLSLAGSFAHQGGGHVFVELFDGTTCDPADLDADGDGFLDVRQAIAGTTSMVGSAGYRRDSPWTECLEIGFSSTAIVTLRGDDRELSGLRLWRNRGGEALGTPAPAPVCVTLQGLPPLAPVSGPAGVAQQACGWPHMHAAGTHLQASAAGGVLAGYPVAETWARLSATLDDDVECAGDTDDDGVTLTARAGGPVVIDKLFPGPGEQGPVRAMALSAGLAATAALSESVGVSLVAGGSVGGVPDPALVAAYVRRTDDGRYRARARMGAAAAPDGPWQVQAFLGGVLQGSFATDDSIVVSSPPGAVVCVADDGAGRPLVELSGFTAATVLAIANGSVPCDRVTLAPAGTCSPAMLSGACTARLEGLPPGVPVAGVRLADVPAAAAFLGVAPSPATSFGLRLSGPNPARDGVAAAFSLPAAAAVRARLFDVSGRAIATLADGRFPAGRHALRWDGRLPGGSAAPAGLYFLRVSRDDRESRTLRFTRLR